MVGQRAVAAVGVGPVAGAYAVVSDAPVGRAGGALAIHEQGGDAFGIAFACSGRQGPGDSVHGSVIHILVAESG